MKVKEIRKYFIVTRIRSTVQLSGILGSNKNAFSASHSSDILDGSYAYNGSFTCFVHGLSFGGRLCFQDVFSLCSGSCALRGAGLWVATRGLSLTE